jgi:fatty acid-binding protein DegV
MNQKTAQGQRLIDQAKTAVENFINKVRDKYNKKKTEQTHPEIQTTYYAQYYSFLTLCR